MPESPEEQQKRVSRELEGKNIAYYSVLLTAWIQTRMEQDKTLVALSIAAIGLLITLLTTTGVQSYLEMVLYCYALLGFIITIWLSLEIYGMNSRHIEEALKGSSENNPTLESYDKWVKKAFIFAIVCAIIIGVISGLDKLFKIRRFLNG